MKYTVPGYSISLLYHSQHNYSRQHRYIVANSSVICSIDSNFDGGLQYSFLRDNYNNIEVIVIKCRHDTLKDTRSHSCSTARRTILSHNHIIQIPNISTRVGLIDHAVYCCHCTLKRPGPTSQHILSSNRGSIKEIRPRQSRYPEVSPLCVWPRGSVPPPATTCAFPRDPHTLPPSPAPVSQHGPSHSPHFPPRPYALQPHPHPHDCHRHGVHHRPPLGEQTDSSDR